MTSPTTEGLVERLEAQAQLSVRHRSADEDDELFIEAAAEITALSQRLSALERENERLREALERIARDHDCGCRPCTGQCRSQIALEIALDEIRDLAWAALKDGGEHG